MLQNKAKEQRKKIKRERLAIKEDQNSRENE